MDDLTSDGAAASSSVDSGGEVPRDERRRLIDQPGGSRQPSGLDSEFLSYAGKMSRHSAFFFAGTIFSVGLGYPFKIYVARKIGAQGLGFYALGVTVVDFLSLFASLGLGSAAARFTATYSGLKAHDRLRNLISGSLSVIVVLSLGLGGALLLSRHFVAETIFGEPDLAIYLPVFSVLLVLNVVIGFLGQTLRGFQEVIRRTTITTFIKFSTRVAVTIALLTLGWRLWGYVVGEVASAVLAVALLVWAVRGRLKGRLDTGLKLPKIDREVWIYAVSMTGLALLGFVTGKADQLLVGVFLDAAQVGVYIVALTTAAFVPLVLQSLNSIFGPVIANLFAQGKTSLLERLFQISTKWAVTLTYPLVTVICLFPAEFMRVFGREFEGGAVVLAVVGLSQAVNVAVGSVGSLLLMSGHQRLEIIVVAITSAITLSLHLTWIPRWGVLGAAASVATGIVLSNLLRLWMVKRYLGLTPYSRGSVRLLVPFVLTAAVVVAVRLSGTASGWVYWASALAALCLAYMTCMAAALVFALDADDRLIARAVWSRARTVLSA